jgi:DHA2 family multidrug resistance protein
MAQGNIMIAGRAEIIPAGARPYVAILGVLVGTVISTLGGRITAFGLADIRGAIHADFDEGAWITTAFTTAQMLIAFPSVWLGMLVGARRVLLWAGAVYTIASLALPLSPDLPTLLFWQAIAGLSSGTFIPLTIGVVLRNLPARLVAYGLSVYAMNSELSQNVAASLEGWFIEHWSWKWIFWCNGLLAPLMMLCIAIGAPREPVNRALLQTGGRSGIVFCSVGFALLYAGLDQGNRLDWLNSGLICGLLLSGAILVTAFLLQELLAPHPIVNLRLAVQGNIPLIALLIVLFRFIILSTAYIIPTYLTSVQGYRSLETGQVLIWIALPQFLLVLISGFMLTRVDSRVPIALGFTLIGAACFMAANLTRDWASGDFLPSQIVQAIGQSFAFSAIVFFATRHIRPADILTFGAFIQTARLFGGELGNAFMQTFVRVREQVHSNLVGLHVSPGGSLVDGRLHDYAGALASRSADPGVTSARAVGLLAAAVQREANVLSYVDGFALIGFTVVGSLLLMLLLSPAPSQDTS